MSDDKLTDEEWGALLSADSAYDNANAGYLDEDSQHYEPMMAKERRLLDGAMFKLGKMRRAGLI